MQSSLQHEDLHFYSQITETYSIYSMMGLYKVVKSRQKEEEHYQIQWEMLPGCNDFLPIIITELAWRIYVQ